MFKYQLQQAYKLNMILLYVQTPMILVWRRFNLKSFFQADVNNKSFKSNWFKKNTHQIFLCFEIRPSSFQLEITPLITVHIAIGWFGTQARAKFEASLLNVLIFNIPHLWTSFVDQKMFYSILSKTTRICNLN